MNKLTVIGVVLIALTSVQAESNFSTFDDNFLAAETHWGGTGSGETGFVSGDWYFPHSSGDYSWEGFVYSNETDNTTAGNGNQYSAITGEGVNGSANYGIGYIPNDWSTYEQVPQTTIAMENIYNQVCTGFYVTNTTYTYWAIHDGDSFTKKFGGQTGNDPDYLKLLIRGYDDQGEYTGTVEVYLADFRFEDNAQDYIVNQWLWVDTSSLGNVVGLEFEMDSSDAGAWGINTPTYFAIDNVPEPATLGLLALGGFAMSRRRHAR